MPTLLSNISKHIQNAYRKAGEFIEDEREFALSESFLNATFQRFITDNVAMLKDLHADVHDDWLRLYATLKYQGMDVTLSVDLKLVQMELNKKLQLIVFEQVSQTKVLDAQYPSILHRCGVYSALFFYQKVLDKDPLGLILEKLNVLKVKDGLLHIDLNRWLGKNKSIIDTLNKVHVNHGVLREKQLVILGNLNLAALLNLQSTEQLNS